MVLIDIGNDVNIDIDSALVNNLAIIKNAFGIPNTVTKADGSSQLDDIYTDYLSIDNYNTSLGKAHAKLNVLINILSQVQTYTQI